jgi:uncharacterized membrane protein YcaP (DUF421 family)
MTGFLNSIDWAQIFLPSGTLVEAAVRGTLCYLFLFAVLRYLLKRQTGAINIADLLLIVLLASAIENALIADLKSVTEGAVIVLTIVFWNHAVNWLGYHSPVFKRFARPHALRIIVDGEADTRRLRHELITTEELMAQLRLHGVARVEDVREAWIEGDGRVSVILAKPDQAPAGGDDDRPGLR